MLTDFVGKTVSEIVHDTYVTLKFTDGTALIIKPEADDQFAMPYLSIAGILKDEE